MVNKTDVIRILLIDDDEDDYILTQDTLSDSGLQFELSWEPDYSKSVDLIKREAHDIYLVDFLLGSYSGLDLIKEVYSTGIKPPIIILTGKGNQKIDFQAMEEGASDYLIKSNLTPSLLERSIRYAVSNAESLKKVKESESKFKGLFEKSVDALFICTTRYEIQEVNQSFFKLFSYELFDIKNLGLKNLFQHEEDYLEIISSLESHGSLKDLEYNLKTKTNTLLECQVSLIPLLDSQSKVVGFQGIIHDLTLRKKAERELLQAELLSVTGKIARSMAHEVRNPLTNLILALEQLKDELPEENEYASMFTDIISRNAGRIDSIISEMLHSSKQNTLNKEKHNVGEVVEESIQMVKDRLTLKGMQLDTDLDILRDCAINLDKEKLKIAMCNIFVNAIEAMEEQKGHLKISSYNIEQSIVMEVKDNGHGISEDHLSKMFNPFFTNKKSGVGLGLTTTKNIIEAHDGYIEIDSKLDEGTVFRIILPC